MAIWDVSGMICNMGSLLFYYLCMDKRQQHEHSHK